MPFFIAVAASALVCVLLWLVHQDLCHQLLPNVGTFLAGLLASVIAVCVNEPQAMLGGLMWGGLYFLLWVWGEGLGGGDVKLALATGTLAGMWGFIAVLSAIFLANVATVLAHFYKRHSGGGAFVAHGPAMIGATTLISVWALT